MMPSDCRRRAVRFIIQTRSARKSFFSSSLFGEPAWDILLTLYAGTLDRERTTAGRLSDVSGAGPACVERWIQALEREGLIAHGGVAPDGADLFMLSDKGWLAMDSYFENMSSTMI